jgi:CubicO group peptidase (beta-lactamase class C family)
LLGPIGMRTAAWDRAAVPAARLAIGVGMDGKVVDPPHWQLGSFEPAGGLYASLDDMAALARFALGGAPHVLAPASLEEMLRDDPLPGPHGVAWVAGSPGEQRLAWHNGSTGDYSATVIVLPEHGLGAIVLAAGPDARLVDCAAAAVLRAAATGAPLGSCK